MVHAPTTVKPAFAVTSPANVAAPVPLSRVLFNVWIRPLVALPPCTSQLLLLNESNMRMPFEVSQVIDNPPFVVLVLFMNSATSCAFVVLVDVRLSGVVPLAIDVSAMAPDVALLIVIAP